MATTNGSKNQTHALEVMTEYLERAGYIGERTKTASVSCRKGKSVQPLDKSKLCDLLNAKTGLERNIPGQMVNGSLLRPAESIKAYRSAVQTTKNGRNTKGATGIGPERTELDQMYQSFKPGLSQKERSALQDDASTCAFYRTQFPNSAYQARITPALQATCKEMKAEVDRAASMQNYEIKKKHMATMTNFFASKNFDLHIRMPTPPVPPDGKKSTGAGKTPTESKASPSKAKRGELDKKATDSQGLKAQASASSIDSEAAKTFICKENIEKDAYEL